MHELALCVRQWVWWMIVNHLTLCLCPCFMHRFIPMGPSGQVGTNSIYSFFQKEYTRSWGESIRSFKQSNRNFNHKWSSFVAIYRPTSKSARKTCNLKKYGNIQTPLPTPISSEVKKTCSSTEELFLPYYGSLDLIDSRSVSITTSYQGSSALLPLVGRDPWHGGENSSGRVSVSYIGDPTSTTTHNTNDMHDNENLKSLFIDTVLLDDRLGSWELQRSKRSTALDCWKSNFQSEHSSRSEHSRCRLWD